MGLVKGLDAIRELVDNTGRDFDDTPKAKWVKVNDGQSVKIDFLQEFDENSPNYNADNGTVLVAIEHSNPKNFQAKALCSSDEGKCLGCEQNTLHPKEGWNRKTRLYANVLVDGDEPYVAILSQGIGPKSITPALVEISNDYGGITTTTFRLKRQGSAMATAWNIVPLPGKSDVDVTKYELYDLEKSAVRQVPYEDQAKFYGLVEAEDAPSEETVDLSW